MVRSWLQADDEDGATAHQTVLHPWSYAGRSVPPDRRARPEALVARSRRGSIRPCYAAGGAGALTLFLFDLAVQSAGPRLVGREAPARRARSLHRHGGSGRGRARHKTVHPLGCAASLTVMVAASQLLRARGPVSPSRHSPASVRQRDSGGGPRRTSSVVDPSHGGDGHSGQSAGRRHLRIAIVQRPATLENGSTGRGPAMPGRAGPRSKTGFIPSGSVLRSADRACAPILTPSPVRRLDMRRAHRVAVAYTVSSSLVPRPSGGRRLFGRQATRRGPTARNRRRAHDLRGAMAFNLGCR
jgi:hypothetical protein